MTETERKTKEKGIMVDLVYNSLYWYFYANLHFFFSHIEVVGSEFIPKKGPVIFVGNHNNQFIDALILMTTCQREVGFIIAQKSLERPLVGFLSKSMKSIGVRRPQDEAKNGTGKIVAKGTNIRGIGTQFTKEIKVGQTIAVKAINETPRVAEIKSDTELILKSPFEKDLDEQGVSFVIRPELDHSQLFSTVWSRLANGRCIGIFPEGGSHDRTELLPLKGGVSLMALGAMDKYDCPVSIVPCGLNYFQGHKFRSHVFVEYGRPYEIPAEMVEKYRKNKREACSELLSIVEQRLRMVTMNYPDLQTMQAVTTARRLYQPKNANLTVEQYLLLNRKFAEGFVKVKDLPVSREILPQLIEYNEELKKYGLKDFQVRDIELEYTYSKYLIALVRIIYLVVLLVASLPGFVVNFPIGATAKYLALQEASKSLQKSDVKIEGKDVIASYKLLVGIVVVPVVFTIYAFFLWAFYSWTPFFTYPFLLFLAYASVRVMEEGVTVWNSSVPLLHALTQRDYNARIKELHDRRQKLKADVRQSVETVGPLLGEELWGTRVVGPEEFAKEEAIESSPSRLHLKYERSKYKSKNVDFFETALNEFADELGIKE